MVWFDLALRVLSLVAMFVAGYCWGVRRFYRWRAAQLQSFADVLGDLGKLAEHEQRRDRAPWN